MALVYLCALCSVQLLSIAAYSAAFSATSDHEHHDSSILPGQPFFPAFPIKMATIRSHGAQATMIYSSSQSCGQHSSSNMNTLFCDSMNQTRHYCCTVLQRCNMYKHIAPPETCTRLPRCSWRATHNMIQPNSNNRQTSKLLTHFSCLTLLSHCRLQLPLPPLDPQSYP